MTIRDFENEFPNDDACLAYMFKLKFEGKPCPKCGKENSYYRVRGRKCYACSKCAKQLSPTAGTIFHKSETSLRTWFYCILLMTNAKNGVSAMELQRHFGMTYKTAWRIAWQIRKVMVDGGDLLSGTVEVDETFIGGVKKFGGPGKGSNKTIVMGMVERGGRAKAKVITNTRGSSMLPVVRAGVAPGSKVMTDTWNAYNALPRMGYRHNAINHSRKSYVHGDLHTNTIEGFWSQMKRSLSGTYHHVSPQHLQHYVNEFAYRYSHRNDDRPLFYSVLAQTLK